MVHAGCVCLPAFNCLRHKCQDIWFHAIECMCAQTRPDILSSESLFRGMESEPMLTPRKKSPLPETQRRVETVTLYHTWRQAKHSTDGAIPSHHSIHFQVTGVAQPELETPSGRMKTSWLHWKDTNWSGTGMSHDHLHWPRLSYREQFKEGDEDADRGNDGKTTSKSWLALNGISYCESWEPQGVDEASCKIYSGASMVSQTMRWDELLLSLDSRKWPPDLPHSKPKSYH